MSHVLIWGSRIGHMCLATDIYLSEQAFGIREKTDDTWSFADAPANGYLADIYRRTLRFAEPESDNAIVNLKDGGYLSWDRNGVLARTPPNFALTDEEEERGRLELARMMHADRERMIAHVAVTFMDARPEIFGP